MYDVNRNSAPEILNSSLEFLVFILTIPQPLKIFILKNLDSKSNEMLFCVLGSKFGTGYLKF